MKEIKITHIQTDEERKQELARLKRYIISSIVSVILGILIGLVILYLFTLLKEL